MKKLLQLTLAFVLAVSLTACGSDKKEGEVKTTVIKIAFNQSVNHPQYIALEEMGKKLKEETNGAYEFDIQPDAILGDQKATAELVQSNTIQMSVVGNPILENYNKDFTAIGLPYVYDSIDHQKSVFESDLLDDLFTSTSSSGFEVVGAFTAGARSVYSNKSAKNPSELSGQKIRVMQSDTMVRMLDAMGGVGTPMAQGEVYTAIQQGILDGGENNQVTYADLKHYEVASTFTLTEHLMVPDLIIANTDFLSGMSEEHREIFNKLMDETMEKEFNLWEDSVDSAVKVAEENGAKFVKTDKKEFKENCFKLNDDLLKDNEAGKKLYDDIRKMSQE